MVITAANAKGAAEETVEIRLETRQEEQRIEAEEQQQQKEEQDGTGVIYSYSGKEKSVSFQMIFFHAFLLS